MIRDFCNFKPIEDPNNVVNLLRQDICHRVRDIKELNMKNEILSREQTENTRLIDIHNNELRRLRNTEKLLTTLDSFIVS